MAQNMAVKNMQPVARVTVTDQVFETLYSKVLTLDLPPATKISEAEVSKQLGVSRQSVRDAFYRLSTLGFLIIKPQSATVVTRISARDVFEARYLRTAIEVENIRNACRSLNTNHMQALEEQIEEQKTAIREDQKELFHQLDNQFHRDIYDFAGLSFTWKSIQEKKAHTDRVRYLSLAFSSQTALEGHVELLAALRDRNPERAETAMRDHLSQIESAIEQLREENHEWFED